MFGDSNFANVKKSGWNVMCAYSVHDAVHASDGHNFICSGVTMYSVSGSLIDKNICETEQTN